MFHFYMAMRDNIIVGNYYTKTVITDIIKLMRKLLIKVFCRVITPINGNKMVTIYD